MSKASPSGTLSIQKIETIKRPTVRTIADAFRYGSPQRPGLFNRNMRKALNEWQTRNAANFERSLADQFRFQHGIKLNSLGAIGHLWLSKTLASGDVIDYGLVSCRVVTDTGVGYIVDAFQGLTALENMKYHGIGVGTTAEAASQTGLVTELTTQYSTANTRPTGSLGEKSGDAKSYETSATITVGTGPTAVTEHGIFSTSVSGTGVMLDRSVFAAINLNAAESIQATYSIQFPSGS